MKDHLKELYYKSNLLQFENDVNYANYSLDQIDQELFTALEKIPNSGKLIRKKIEANPEVSVLRNRLDDWDHYGSKPYNRDKLSKAMRDDLFNLMKIRNNVARDLGYCGYVDAALVSDGLLKEDLVHELNWFLEKNLDAASAFASENKMTWEAWFSDLNRISKASQILDLQSEMSEFLGQLGLENAFESVSIYHEKAFAFTTMCGDNDIRMVLSKDNSLFGLTTAYHEMGHAFAYGINKTKSYEITPCIDEMFAVMVENVASVLMMGGYDRSIVKRIIQLEYTRAAISALFELSLWDDPERGEMLYREFYERLLAPVENSDRFILDSFRSIDPMRIYAYPLGQIAAERFLNKYRGLSNNAIGEKLAGIASRLPLTKPKDLIE